MTFGEQNTEKEARDMLNYAFDNGINILDTSEVVSVILVICESSLVILRNDDCCFCLCCVVSCSD